MAASFLQQIDWSRPWLAPLRAAAQTVLSAADWRDGLNAAARQAGLHNHRGLPIHFVAQADLPAGVAYETFISASGGVPTRDNLHDFFNALVWLTFPQIKRQLNALQAAEIDKAISGQGVTHSAAIRGKVRDAATIFDENAALLVACDAQWAETLRAHRWREALLEQRSAFGRTVDVFLFGHALMEKLACPYKAITAHAWVMPGTPDLLQLPLREQIAWLDHAIARRLEIGLATADFTPLPVLGVPGWWPDQDENFYMDVNVFRPKRQLAP